MQKNEMMNLIRKAKDRDPDAFTTLMQQKELTDKGAAVVLKEQKDYSKLAVTDNGITITPETIIVDENFAHIAFSVKGYDLAEGDEPGFDDWNIGVKDGKKISFLGDAGGTGYNEAMTEAYTLSSFVQVIEPDQVQAIILRNDDGEQIEIPIR